MPAGTFNIIVEKGATFTKTLTLTDDSDNPVDLTNVTDARSQLRTRPQDTVAFDFDVSVDSDGTLGLVSWTMSAAVTKTIPAGKGSYDLEIQWADGTIQRLLEGTATVRENITRE